MNYVLWANFCIFPTCSFLGKDSLIFLLEAFRLQGNVARSEYHLFVAVNKHCHLVHVFIKVLFTKENLLDGDVLIPSTILGRDCFSGYHIRPDELIAGSS